MSISRIDAFLFAGLHEFTKSFYRWMLRALLLWLGSHKTSFRNSVSFILVTPESVICDFFHEKVTLQNGNFTSAMATAFIELFFALQANFSSVRHAWMYALVSNLSPILKCDGLPSIISRGHSEVVSKLHILIPFRIREKKCLGHRSQDYIDYTLPGRNCRSSDWVLRLLFAWSTVCSIQRTSFCVPGCFEPAAGFLHLRELEIWPYVRSVKVL